MLDHPYPPIPPEGLSGTRAEVVALKATPFDVVVIGGGITGAATAREAALRGYSAALIEQGDFASGTSSRSAKFIHGGVRYLETFDFGLVRESCRERETMHRLAPHLTAPQAILFVSNAWAHYRPWQLNIGLTFYDYFSGNPSGRKHRMYNRQKLLEIEPGLNPEGLYGAGLLYDMRTNDARLTIETVKGASAAGAQVANYVEALGLEKSSGRLSGVRVRDLVSGEVFAVAAGRVINATGPWVDRLRDLDEPGCKAIMSPAKGAHLVFSAERLPINHGIFMHVKSDRRLNYILPAPESGTVYIGATDTFYDGNIDRVSADDSDVDYLLGAANFMFPKANLAHDDIVSTWAGLRPLVKSKHNKSASQTARTHQVLQSSSGLLTIAGGKLSTARAMAMDTINFMERFNGLPPTISVSEKVALSGGAPLPARLQERATAAGLPEDRWRSIIRRFGSNTPDVLALIEATPDLARRVGELDVVAAEIIYFCRHEHAVTLSDILSRRVGALFWKAGGGMEDAREVCAIAAPELDWNSDRIETELAAHADWVSENRRFRQRQTIPDLSPALN
jgi:glycerol-3-phosphate dehydrogenase